MSDKTDRWIIFFAGDSGDGDIQGPSFDTQGEAIAWIDENLEWFAPMILVHGEVWGQFNL